MKKNLNAKYVAPKVEVIKVDAEMCVAASSIQSQQGVGIESYGQEETPWY